MSESLHLNVSYSQIAVFSSTIKQPFNNWTDNHVKQGFAWRPQAVSFRTLEDGVTTIEVNTKGWVALQDTCIRAIQVPYAVPASSKTEIASITDSLQFEITSGKYSLIFETGRDKNNASWCLFSFIPGGRREAKILKADSEIIIPTTLIMTAEPA